MEPVESRKSWFSQEIWLYTNLAAFILERANPPKGGGAKLRAFHGRKARWVAAGLPKGWT
jgi:hypothetical protein